MFHPDETSPAPLPSPRKKNETTLGGFVSSADPGCGEAVELPALPLAPARLLPPSHTAPARASAHLPPISFACLFLSPALPFCCSRQLLLEHQDVEPREERRCNQEEGSCCAAKAGASCCAAAASAGGSCCATAATASAGGSTRAAALSNTRSWNATAVTTTSLVCLCSLTFAVDSTL